MESGGGAVRRSLGSWEVLECGSLDDQPTPALPNSSTSQLLPAAVFDGGGQVIMAATVYGDVNFGLSAETGLYVATVDHEATISDKWVPDEQGADVAGSLFNPIGSWSMQGVLNTGETLTAKLGSALVLANVVDWSDIIDNGYTTGGTSFVTSHKIGQKNDDFESRDLAGGFRPFVVAGA